MPRSTNQPWGMRTAHFVGPESILWEIDQPLETQTEQEVHPFSWRKGWLSLSVAIGAPVSDSYPSSTTWADARDLAPRQPACHRDTDLPALSQMAEVEDDGNESG